MLSPFSHPFIKLINPAINNSIRNQLLTSAIWLPDFINDWRINLSLMDGWWLKYYNIIHAGGWISFRVCFDGLPFWREQSNNKQNKPELKLIQPARLTSSNQTSLQFHPIIKLKLKLVWLAGWKEANCRSI